MKQPLEVLIFILLAMAMGAIWIQLLNYILRLLEQDTTFTDPGPSNAIIYQIPKRRNKHYEKTKCYDPLRAIDVNSVVADRILAASPNSQALSGTVQTAISRQPVNSDELIARVERLTASPGRVKTRYI